MPSEAKVGLQGVCLSALPKQPVPRLGSQDAPTGSARASCGGESPVLSERRTPPPSEAPLASWSSVQSSGDHSPPTSSAIVLSLGLEGFSSVPSAYFLAPHFLTA